MTTQIYKRVCGHEEALDVDKTSPLYERKIACIARTRCKACVRAIDDRQKEVSRKRKDQRHQEQVIRHKHHLDHIKVELEHAREQAKKPSGRSLESILFTMIKRTLASQNGLLLEALSILEQRRNA